MVCTGDGNIYYLERIILTGAIGNSMITEKLL